MKSWAEYFRSPPSLDYKPESKFQRMVCTPGDAIYGTWATAAPFRSKHQPLKLTEHFAPNALTGSHEVSLSI